MTLASKNPDRISKSLIFASTPMGFSSPCLPKAAWSAPKPMASIAIWPKPAVQFPSGISTSTCWTGKAGCLPVTPAPRHRTTHAFWLTFNAPWQRVETGSHDGANLRILQCYLCIVFRCNRIVTSVPVLRIHEKRSQAAGTHPSCQSRLLKVAGCRPMDPDFEKTIFKLRSFS